MNGPAACTAGPSQKVNYTKSSSKAMALAIRTNCASVSFTDSVNSTMAFPMKERALSAQRPQIRALVGGNEIASRTRVSCPPSGGLQRRQGTRPAPWPRITGCRAGNYRRVGSQSFKSTSAAPGRGRVELPPVRAVSPHTLDPAISAFESFNAFAHHPLNLDLLPK